MSDGAYPKIPPESHPMDDPGASPVKQPSAPSPNPTPAATGGAAPAHTVTGGGVQVWMEQPQSVTCPHCQADVITETHTKGGLVAWATCGACCFFGLFFIIPLLLCWLPFCIAPMKDTYHTCPSCHRLLGKRGALGLNV